MGECWLYKVLAEGEASNGITRVITKNGQKIRWRIYASVRGNAKVSFSNPQGERVEKTAKELNDEERVWFWKLDQSKAQVFRMPLGINLPKTHRISA